MLSDLFVLLFCVIVLMCLCASSVKYCVLLYGLMYVWLCGVRLFVSSCVWCVKQVVRCCMCVRVCCLRL